MKRDHEHRRAREEDLTSLTRGPAFAPAPSAASGAADVQSPSPLRGFISPLIEHESQVHGFTKAEVHEVMGGIYGRGDRLMLRFLLAHAVIALGLAFFFKTWTATVLTTIISVGGFAASARLWPRSFVTRCVAGIAVQTFVALHIYQLHGLAEMHFFFFTGFTMMLVYQEGRSMWPGAWLIIGQHIVFAFLHNKGVPLHFFEVQHISVTRLFFHFGIALTQVAICAYWSVLLRRQTLRDAWQKGQLHETGTRLTEQLETIVESEHALRESTQALSESMRRQREILDNIPDLAWLKDHEGRYVAVNATFTQTFHTPEADVMGRTDADFFPAALAERLRDHDREVKQSRTQRRFEDKYLDRSTQWRDIDTIITPIVDASGEVAGTMGIARDITDRMRADEERRRLEERMQRAQRFESIGVLAGGVAHDFNNLLVGVLGNAGLARDMPGNTPELDETLRDIEVAAMRASQLTQQLLAYAGRGHFVVERVDLSILVAETAALLRAAISRKAQVHFDLATVLPAVEVDATQLRQVVMNLITNASEALGEEGGTITLRTASTTLTGSDLLQYRGAEDLRPGAFVMVTISDSGSGMSGATLDRVFDPFFTTKFTGRGLGLAAVMGIVRSHGGGIRVESLIGKGSGFSLIFPAMPGPVAPATLVADVAHGLAEFAGSTVLVVDDDPYVRSVTCRLLERAGLVVILAEDGIDGLEKLRASEGAVHAIVLDILMPKMDGVEMLREARRGHPSLGVVMTSGFTERDAADRLDGMSYSGILHKPYNIGTLHAMVRRALLRSSGREEPAHPEEALLLTG